VFGGRKSLQEVVQVALESTRVRTHSGSGGGLDVSEIGQAARRATARDS
jgi:hypothetical protein